MKKKTNKNQIVEIHIYVHQANFSSPMASSGAGGSITFQCTCDMYKGNGATSAPCPLHPNGRHYVTATF